MIFPFVCISKISSPVTDDGPGKKITTASSIIFLFKSYSLLNEATLGFGGLNENISGIFGESFPETLIILTALFWALVAEEKIVSNLYKLYLNLFHVKHSIYLFIARKKSSLDLLCFNLSDKKSIASTGPICIKILLNTHILDKVSF